MLNKKNDVESPVVEENEFDGGRSRRILRNRRI